MDLYDTERLFNFEVYVRTALISLHGATYDHPHYPTGQEMLEKRQQPCDPDYMLRILDTLYRSQGLVRPGLLRLNEKCAQPEVSAERGNQ
jgi:hypothetical protein